MKRIIFISLLIISFCLLAGCGSSRYSVVKKDGTSVTSVGEPDFSEESSSYSFKDPDGNKVILNREEVQEIKEMKEK